MFIELSLTIIGFLFAIENGILPPVESKPSYGFTKTFLTSLLDALSYSMDLVAVALP